VSMRRTPSRSGTTARPGSSGAPGCERAAEPGAAGRLPLDAPSGEPLTGCARFRHAS
jgi:hypothetical protein